MNSTKNVKGNRKMLEVTYHEPLVDYYKIPDGLDLEDKTVVKSYWVKYRTLYIEYVGKKDREEIETEYEDANDFKHPSNLQIEDADNNFVNYNEEDAKADAEEEDTNRNITIYILSDGETWGMEGENRKATEEDVEKWGENYNIELGDWIGVVNDDEFLTGKSVSTLLVTANELEELNEGKKVRHLDDYYERLVCEEEEEEEESEVVFCCFACEKEIIRNSEEHDNCVCDDDCENWTCADCVEEKEEEERKYQECCDCKSKGEDDDCDCNCHDEEEGLNV